MAERKTKYTNADLRAEGGPATEVGPWKTVDQRYDEMLNEPSIDEILTGAKHVANRRSVTDDASGKPTRAEEIRRLGQRASMPTQTEQELRRSSTLGGIARDTLDLAMIPASFSPLAPVATAYFGARGLEDFAENPSVGSGAMAALGALPYVGKAGKALGGLLPKAKAPMTQSQWARNLKPSQVAAKADQWTPARPPAPPSGPSGQTGTGWEPRPWSPTPPPGPRGPVPGGWGSPGSGNRKRADSSRFSERPPLNMEGLPGPPTNFVPQPYGDPQRQKVRSAIDSLVASDTPAPRGGGLNPGVRITSMDDLLGDVPEFQLRDAPDEVFSSVDEATGFGKQNYPQASEPEDLTDILDALSGRGSRHPMGASGDEYASIPKGPYTDEGLAALTEEWPDEFLEEIARGLGPTRRR